MCESLHLCDTNLSQAVCALTIDIRPQPYTRQPNLVLTTFVYECADVLLHMLDGAYKGNTSLLDVVSHF